jgi:hypothetical protein
MDDDEAARVTTSSLPHAGTSTAAGLFAVAESVATPK